MQSGVAKKVAKKAQPEIANRAAVLDNELKTFRDDYRPPATLADATLSADGKDRTNDFPVKVSEPDERDTYMDLKTSLIGNNANAATKFGMATLSDKDMRWMEKKRQQAQLVDYNKFAANYFDLKNPAVANFAYGIMPELLQEREQQIDQVAQLQAKIAKIRLRGVQSKEDMGLVYGLKSGNLEPPQGAVYQPSSWYPGTTVQSAFNRGIFSPRRYSRGNTGKPNERYDIGGDNVGPYSTLGYLNGRPGARFGDDALAQGYHNGTPLRLT